MKNILITGHDGFIGKQLKVFLKEKGYNTITIEQDIRDPIKINKKIDVLIHLAAWLDNQDKEKIYDINVNGTLNLLNFCRDNNIKFIFASTNQVYGNQKNLPTKESDKYNPYNLYGKTKIEGENLCKKYSESYNLNCIILRLSNVYGKDMKEGYAIYDILYGTKNNKTIHLNQPDVRRDFIHIKDVMGAFLKSIEYNKRKFDIFNISYGKSYALEEIVDIVSKFLKKDVSVEYSRAFKEEVLDNYQDISHAKSDLDWCPKIDFVQGINNLLSS